VVPPQAELSVWSIARVPSGGGVVGSTTETYKGQPPRKRKTEEEEGPGCEQCEQLKCLEMWCSIGGGTLPYYVGEWQEDGYVPRQQNSFVIVPAPLGPLVEYINSRLNDIKLELCEAIDLVAFLDQEPEPFTDRRRHGPQWRIYWGLRKHGQQSMKKITLPEVERMEMPPEPPAIHDGKICLHYGIESVGFWGRIWVGRTSAEALERYLRQIYGENVKFTRSESPNRQGRRGELVPTRARYWNGQRWHPPVRWQPRPWEGQQ
jgi:hypothetical protein